MMHAWAAQKIKMPNTGENKGNNPKGYTWLEVDVTPVLCDCAKCGETALICPPEDGSPPTGYCICPRCTLGHGAASLGQTERSDA